ncbi:MAG: NADH-quinone oxidoreductase subunit NuoH [Acidobacteria bacterium]|nr:NADH-quinone oxidoreductase subunit NuoH [Acidobacteriota bacterium]MBI3658313.1 NADH-quinone oxidoreductase subunit NuoH [Acidobacteriota bacterium]
MTEIVITMGKIAFVLFCVFNLLYVLLWLERKQSAVMQDRIGANRADIFGLRAWGLFHPIADAIKMICKEDFMPAAADKFVYTAAPFLAVFFSLVGFAVIPFGDTLTLGGHTIHLQIADLNVGLLYVFAMLSLGVYGFILAGWASNNNFAFLGGMRAGSQMISYEITMGATVMGLVILFQTLSLNQMVQAQGEYFFGFIPKWGVLLQPLGFLLFLIAGIAETKRIPFDLPEGESEIIGYFVEYSGMKFGMFMMTDFIETILLSAMLTTLFFGGWQIPYLHADGFHLGGLRLAINPVLVSFLQVAAFGLKVFCFCWLLLLIRWTLPRFRYDQLMALGWKFMLPLSLLNLAITGLVVLL